MKPIEELTFTDDYVFGAVMHNKDICRKILELLLKIKIKDITYPELQKTIKPYYSSKGVRLDVYVEGDNKIYEIEMQSKMFEEMGLRTRYYQSMIDIDNLMRGADYKELKESMIIFICKKVPFEKQLPVYTFSSTCKENSEVPLNDKCSKIILNADAYKDSTDKNLQAFLKFLLLNQADDKLTNEIYNKVETLKCQELFKQDYFSMNLHDVDLIDETRKEDRRNTAIKCLELNLPVETITAITGLSAEKILELKNFKN